MQISRTSPRDPQRKDPLCASVFPWRRNRCPANLTIESEIITRRKTGHAFRCGTTTYLNAMASRDENWFIKDSCGGSRLSSWRWSRELFRDLRRGHKNAWVRRGEMFELSHTKAVFRMIYSCTLYYAVCTLLPHAFFKVFKTNILNLTSTQVSAIIRSYRDNVYTLHLTAITFR